MNHRNEVTQWPRKCPKCGGTIYHQSKKDRDRREREGRTCGGKVGFGCKVISKQQRRLLSTSLKGRAPNHDQTKRRKKSTPTPYSRNCPTCGRKIYYSNEGHIKYSERTGRLCDSCTKYKYKLTWKDVITEASIKKMRATKAGFSSWSEYVKKFPKWKRYKAEVWRLTYKNLRNNPPLPNYDKKGLCGVPGAYQTDHILGVRLGFDKKIRPEIIAEYKNLRMIPWKENLSKG